MTTPVTLKSFVRLLVGGAALLGVAACEQTGALGGDWGRGGYPQAQSSEDPIMMQTNAANYRAGEPVITRLTNRTGRRVGYNLCRSRVEQRNDEGDWRPVPAAEGEVCTAELRSLSPGQSATYSFRLARSSRPGPYRIRTTLEDLRGGPRLDVVSNAFSLTRDSD